MKNNKLSIRIERPITQVFAFTITPPNTTKWIGGIVAEETNELPVQVGTVYTLRDTIGNISEYTIVVLEKDKLVEWMSKDGSYHVRYAFAPVDGNTTDFEYHEWVDKGDIPDPFTLETLAKLKKAIENL